MGRKRMLDTDGLFFDTKLVRQVKARGLLIYERLWALAEDSGVYLADYEDIAYQMGALDANEKEIRETIERLMAMGKIIEFNSNDELDDRRFHYIVNFHNHQRLVNSMLPRYPLPPWITYEEKQYKNGRKYAVFHVDEKQLPKIAKQRKGISSKRKEEANPAPETKKYWESFTQEYQLCKLLLDLILKNLPNFNQPEDDLQAWCAEMDLMLRRDKREPRDVEMVIRWAQRDNFWSRNVLSPKKLRKQYDQLMFNIVKDAEKGMGPLANKDRSEWPVDVRGDDQEE